MAPDAVWMTATARHQLEVELAEIERAEGASATATLPRVLELRELLRHAEVDRKPDDGLVEAGMRVTVRFHSDGSESTFLLGSRELSGLDPSVDTDVFSPSSPLGAAISGRYVGDVVTFAAPAGEQTVTVLSAVPFG